MSSPVCRWCSRRWYCCAPAVDDEAASLAFEEPLKPTKATAIATVATTLRLNVFCIHCSGDCIQNRKLQMPFSSSHLQVLFYRRSSKLAGNRSHYAPSLMRRARWRSNHQAQGSRMANKMMQDHATAASLGTGPLK